MKILIIEDESRIAGRIQRMTSAYFGPLSETIKCDNIKAGITYLQANAVDLLLLDLNLNGENGFDVLQTMTAGSYHTIIISAHADKAITAFHYGVIDFVPKPFGEDRLHQAFRRLTQKQVPRDTYIEYLGIRKAGSIEFIDIKQLQYIKGAGIYTELYLADGKTELCDKSLEQLMQLFPPVFVRSHKSYIVPVSNMLRLKISLGSRYILQLKSGQSLPVGRTRLQYLKTHLGL